MEYREVNIQVSCKQRVSNIISGIQGMSLSETGQNLGISLNIVRKRRRRWKSVQEELNAFEHDESGKSKIIFYARGYLRYFRQSEERGPKRTTLAQEQQIAIVGCEKPKKHGIEIDYWTNEMLAHVAIARKIVESITLNILVAY